MTTYRINTTGDERENERTWPQMAALIEDRDVGAIERRRVSSIIAAGPVVGAAWKVDEATVLVDLTDWRGRYGTTDGVKQALDEALAWEIRSRAAHTQQARALNEGQARGERWAMEPMGGF